MIIDLNSNTNKLEEVMKVWLEINIDAHDFICKEYWIKNYDLVRELPKEADVYIFEENDVVKGFIGAVENNYIGGIFIKKEYQRDGAGQGLMDFCKATYSCLALNVLIKDERAMNSYNKNGFVVLEELINEDAKEREYFMSFEQK